MNTARRQSTAVLVSVGDELLGGAHADLNSPWLAGELEDVGLETQHVHVVGDDEEQLAALVAQELERHVLVVVSGGLGPTLDDVTRHALARAVGRELCFDGEAWRQVKSTWERRGETPPEANRRQALVPRGAELFPNSCGTAPGFCVELDGPRGRALVACLPGPPNEYQAMAREQLLPRVASRLVDEARRPAVARGTLWGIGESSFADRAGDWLARDADPVVGVCARSGLLVLKALSRGPGAQARVDARMAELAQRFDRHWVGPDHAPLEETLVRELTRLQLRLAAAESCTGGLVAGALTSVPGSSAVLERAFVTYSNASKCELLGVPPALIERHGAVSREVAAAMAHGARARSGVDLAVAVTGVAGPDGGSPDKPVGRVEFALAAADGTWTVGRTFPNFGRERIRRFAVHQALALVLWTVRGRRADLGLEPAAVDTVMGA